MTQYGERSRKDQVNTPPLESGPLPWVAPNFAMRDILSPNLRWIIKVSYISCTMSIIGLRLLDGEILGLIGNVYDDDGVGIGRSYCHEVLEHSFVAIKVGIGRFRHCIKPRDRFSLWPTR